MQTNPKKYIFDQKKIDWSEFESLGLSKERFINSKDLEMMLKGELTSKLYILTIENEEGSAYQASAKLSFKRKNDNTVGLKLHLVQSLDKTFEKPYFGYHFSKEEQSVLKQSVNLGKVVDLRHPYNGSVYSCFVSLDSETGRLYAMDKKALRMPDKVNGIKLSDEQKSLLKEGKFVPFDAQANKANATVPGFLQINAIKRSFEFISEYDVRIIQTKDPQIPRYINGQEIELYYREKLSEGQTVCFKHQGQSIYMRMNFAKGYAEYSTNDRFDRNVKKVESNRQEETTKKGKQMRL